jgi:hypothetical protein
MTLIDFIFYLLPFYSSFIDRICHFLCDKGSHDIYSMRDMRDALGALGPVDGKNPELNNLTVAMTIVDRGDIVFLTSDGISDNFDPVVGKFAIPKKEKPYFAKTGSSDPANEG